MPRKSDLSTSDIEKLAVLVENEVCLYQPSHQDYHDKQRAFNIWSRISQEMGNSELDGEYWKKKWRNLRDTYVKKRREAKTKKSGQGCPTMSKWPYMDILSFLDRHVEENNTESNVPATQDRPTDVDDHEHEYTIECSPETVIRDGGNCSDEESNRSTITPRARNQKRKKEDPIETALLGLMDVHRKTQQTPYMSSPEGAFFESCRHRMKQLSSPIKSAVRLQISQLFYNAENPCLPPQQIIPLPTIQLPYMDQQMMTVLQASPTCQPPRSATNLSTSSTSETDVISSAMNYADI